MEESQDKISRARAELGTAQINLLEAYLSKIREGYQTLKKREGQSVLDGLDDLVKSMEGQRSTEKFPRMNSAFDREKAIKIRKEAGFSLKELAKELEFPLHRYVQLQGYENGRNKPGNPPKGMVSKPYIEWLKQHGYNPFGL